MEGKVISILIHQFVSHKCDIKTCFLTEKYERHNFILVLINPKSESF